LTIFTWSEQKQILTVMWTWKKHEKDFRIFSHKRKSCLRLK